MSSIKKQVGDFPADLFLKKAWHESAPALDQIIGPNIAYKHTVKLKLYIERYLSTLVVNNQLNLSTVC
jgi:hypothetical protein